MSDGLAWIRPGARATLLWIEGGAGGSSGAHIHQIAGPLLERPPESPYVVLAPAGADQFSARLYAGLATLGELRQFLSICVIARGRVDSTLETVVTDVETPVLPVLDHWRVAGGPPMLPYLADIAAFLPHDLPVHVSEEGHAVAVTREEAFQRVWVCAECGDPEDASVFLWSARMGPTVRACLLIENEGGRWTCHLHPFEFLRPES